MKGFKVTSLDYSGKLHGDTVVYVDKQAAEYVFAKQKSNAANYARSEETPEIRFHEVDYSPLGSRECRVGRVIHGLDKRKRSHFVKNDALAKLSAEEKDALGL